MKSMWKFTRNEIFVLAKNQTETTRLLIAHRAHVLGALMRGEQLRQEVLDDYPDLPRIASRGRRAVRERAALAMAS